MVVSRIAPRLTSVLLPVLLIALVGCRVKLDVNENDRLRARVLDLEDEIAALEGRSAELEAELASADAAPGTLPAEVRAHVPHVTSITIGRFSHVREAEDGTGVNTMILYVDPADGRGRFVQLVGELSVHVAILPDDDDAVTIGAATFGPGTLRDAYRSGFAGTHYTIEVPLEAMTPDGRAWPEACDVRVVYTDARTGGRYEAHRAVDLE